jgi:hypothetical protein
MLANGSINRNTFVIAVEYNKRNVSRIRKFLQKHFKNFEVYEGTAASMYLEPLLKDRKIDYMFFDMCGNFEAHISNWFHKNQEHFKPYAKIWITARATFRKGKCRKALRSYVGKRIMDGLGKKLSDVTTNVFSHYLSTGDITKHIQDIMQFIYLSFDKTDIDFTGIYKYRDGSDMALVGLQTKGVCDNGFDYDAYVKNYNRRVCAAKKITYGYARGQWPGKKLRKQRKRKAAPRAVQNYADLLKVKNEKDLNKRGVKIAIGRYAVTYDTTPDAIRAGVRRTFTVRKQRKQTVLN